MEIDMLQVRAEFIGPMHKYAVSQYALLGYYIPKLNKQIT